MYITLRSYLPFGWQPTPIYPEDVASRAIPTSPVAHIYVVKRKVPDSAESNKRAKTQGPCISNKNILF